MAKKTVWFAGAAVGLATNLYTTFVLQQLWNWFLAPAISVTTVSYWRIYGVQMLLRLLTKPGDHGEAYLWERAIIMFKSCVPTERLESMTQELDKHDKELWVPMASSSISDLAGASLALVLGWAINLATS